MMPGWLVEGYAWIKALHVMAVIAWMAGLFYLPRLFVYHVKAQTSAEMARTFKVMERRLYRAIMMPAMVLAWMFGVLMIGIMGLDHGWLHAKLALVFLMSIYHFVLGWHVRQFAVDANERSEKYFRLINEIPTLLMVVIVVLVVVKPF